MSPRLRRAIAIHCLIASTLLVVAAVRVARTARHPLRYARYLTARALRRVPRRDPNGEPLDPGEMRAFIGVVQCWRYPAAPERTPYP